MSHGLSSVREEGWVQRGREGLLKEALSTIASELEIKQDLPVRERESSAMHQSGFRVPNDCLNDYQATLGGE